MKNYQYLLLLSVLVVTISCVKMPKQSAEYNRFEKIQVGAGPEDLQLYFDAASANYAMLVSCDDRRKTGVFGSIWKVDLETHIAKPLILQFKNTEASFHPHGIHLFDNYLFVIDHDDKYKKSRIFRFEIKGDTLVEETLFQKGLIGAPNDIVAISKDVFMYANYSFNGSVVRYENGTYTNIIKRLRKPNGIDSITINGFPFGLVSTTIGGKVYRFDTQTGEKKKLTNVKGADNFTYFEDKLLVTGHLRFGKFIKHFKNAKNPSPSVVYVLDVLNASKKAIFVDNGLKISAVSTALQFHNRVYLGQIFENYILVGFLK